jgi:hypothetical protein
MTRGRVAAFATWFGLAALTFGLYLLRGGSLSAPPLTIPDRVQGWWQQHGPVEATFAVLRLGLFWTGCYLLALWTAGSVAGLRPDWRLASVLRHRCLPGAQVVVRAAVGLTAAGTWCISTAESSFAASGGGSVAPTATAPNHNPAPILRYVGPPDEPFLRPATRTPPSPSPGPDRTSSSDQAPRVGATPTPPLQRTTIPFRPGPGSGGSPSRRTPSSLPPPVAPARLDGRAAATGQLRNARRAPAALPPAGSRGPAGGRVVWVVRPGDDLWSIAAASLTAVWGRPPVLEELGPYWWRVVEVNRPHLPNPANPNLLFPGDRVILPPLPARPH